MLDPTPTTAHMVIAKQYERFFIEKLKNLRAGFDDCGLPRLAEK
jgi:hypothetical protein